MAGSPFTQSPLFRALTHVTPSTPGLVTRLLDSGQVDPSLRGDYGETYLHLAVGNFEKSQVPVVLHLIYLLVDAGVDLNAVDLAGNSPLHVAAMNQLHPNVISACIKAGSDLRITNAKGNDVLSLCKKSKSCKATVEWFHPGLAEGLKGSHREVVQRCVLGWCSLYSGGDAEECVQRALRDAPAAAGGAAGTGTGGAVGDYIRQHRNTNILIHAVLSGDVQSVVELLEKGDSHVDVNARDPTFYSDTAEGMIECPLVVYALYIHMYDTAKVLLKLGRGLDVDAPIVIKTAATKTNTKTGTKTNPEADTSGSGCAESTVPLFHYILYHFEPAVSGDIYRYIVKKSNMDTVEKKDRDALLLKSWEVGHGAEVLHEFLIKGWDPFTQNEAGLWLRERILEESLRMCMPKCSDIRGRAFWVDALVVDMAARGDTKQLRELLMSGYEYINVMTPGGVNAQEIAACAGHPVTAGFLETADSLIQQRRQLHMFIRRGHLPKVRALTSQASASQTLLRSRDRAGRTPQVTAVIFDRKYILSHLLECDSTAVNLADKSGRTPLHYAAGLQNHADFETMLLNAGGDPDVKDKRGKMATAYRSERSTDFIQKERGKETGENSFLLDRYLSLLDMVSGGNLGMVRCLRRTLIGYSLGHVEQVVCAAFPLLESGGLIWSAVDAGNEEMALFLVAEGADIAQERTIDGTRQTLSNTAKSKGFTELYSQICAKLKNK